MASNRASLRFQLVGVKPADVSVRAWNDALRAGWFAIGVYHDTVVEPRKFQSDAATRYGFQRRTAKYLAFKAKVSQKTWKVKNEGDLVLSGRTRTAVLRTQYPQAFPTRMVLELPTPDYIQMRPKKSGRPNLGEELTSVTADEQREMEALFVATVEQQLAEWSGGRR